MKKPLFFEKLNSFSKALISLSEEVNEAAHTFFHAVIRLAHVCIVLITIWTLMKMLFAEIVRFAA